MSVSATGGGTVGVLAPKKDSQQPTLIHLERVQDKAFDRAANPVADSVNLDCSVTEQVTSPVAFNVMRGLSDTNNAWAPTVLESLKHKKLDTNSQEGCEHVCEMLCAHHKDDLTDNAIL